MSRFAAIARGFMANELTASDLETKHRQLLRLIWTRNGMGERYYRVLAPDMRVLFMSGYSDEAVQRHGMEPQVATGSAIERLATRKKEDLRSIG